MHRRTLLKAAGISLLLPQLESFGEVKQKKTKRLFTIVNHLGFYQPELIPSKDKQEPELLKVLGDHKENIRLFSQLDNPGVQLNNGHTPCVGILSGYFNKLQRKNRISIDQQAALKLGRNTRFSSLSLQAGNNLNFSQVCWDKHGLPVHQIDSPENAFDLLFGVAKDHKTQKQILAEDKSILDLIYKQADSLSKKMNSHDKRKIDEYFTSIREVEKEVKRKAFWSSKPKPTSNAKISAASPSSVENYLESMLKLAVLAQQTDSTRVTTVQIPFWESFKHDDLSDNYHNLSHHGQKESKIKKLLMVEKKVLKKIAEAISSLKNIKTNGVSLFDETSVLITSPMGSASAHNFNDLPAIYMDADVSSFASIRTSGKPICSLYLSILQKLGLEIDSFGEGKKSLELT